MNHLITASGWVAATGLLAMFLTAQTRLSTLQEKYAGLERSHQELAFESRAETRQAATDRHLRSARSRALPAARPAVPAARPLTRVNVRERSPLRARLTRLMEEVGTAPGNPDEEISEVAEPSGSEAGDEINSAATAAGAKQSADRAKKNKSFLASLDRMIADLDQTIESGRGGPEKAVTAEEAAASTHEAPVAATTRDARPVKPRGEEKRPVAKPATPEVQVIYVHPFGSRKNGTWVKYHRYEKAGSNKVKFFFGDQEVFTAPQKAVEWEQRVLIN